MAKKDILLKECIEVMATPKVTAWYEAHLTTRAQADTVNDLTRAIVTGELTAREALSIALIVGYQWDLKFEGVT